MPGLEFCWHMCVILVFESGSGWCCGGKIVFSHLTNTSWSANGIVPVGDATIYVIVEERTKLCSSHLNIIRSWTVGRCVVYSCVQ